jgi:GTP cyclohydrolase II
LFGEAFHALDCECAEQLSNTLAMIRRLGKGVVAYEYAEGRGVGLEKKIQAIQIQRTNGLDTVEAFAELGLKPDLRSYDLSIRALKELSLSKTIKLATQNPNKAAAVKTAGFEIVETLPPKVTVTPLNKPELIAKKYKLGHSIDTV